MRAEVRRDAKGTWYAQPYLGTAPDGRQIRPRRSFPGASSREEAQAMADAWASRLTLGGKVESALIVDLLYGYIGARRAKGASENTVKRWRLFTRAYVGRYLAGKAAPDLTAADLDAFEGRLLADKSRGGAGLSRNTVIGVHHFLRGAYGYWCRIGVCDQNPMLDVPKPAAERHEAVAVDEWDYRALNARLSELMAADWSDARQARRSVHAFAAWVALHTGMRRGEVCALRRRDYSRRRRRFEVRGNLVSLAGGGVRRENVTKNRSTRSVALTDSDMAVVDAWIRRQDAFSGAFSPDSALVSVDGSFMHPESVSRGFARIRDECGMPKGCTFHSLRHTHATWCLENGVNLKQLAARLGHRDEATTLRLYAHLMPGGDEQAAEAFEEFAERVGKGV